MHRFIGLDALLHRLGYVILSPEMSLCIARDTSSYSRRAIPGAPAAFYNAGEKESQSL